VKVAFKDPKLRRLVEEGTNAEKLPLGIYEALLEIMVAIVSARDERDLYQQRSLNMERLHGDRKGQYSIRLNKQYRLCFEIHKDRDGNLIWILEIVDYH
jgi:toxin HigB-1